MSKCEGCTVFAEYNINIFGFEIKCVHGSYGYFQTSDDFKRFADEAYESILMLEKKAAK